MSAKKVNRLVFYLTLAILIVLFLSAINIRSFLTPLKTEVLGAETQENDRVFWQDLVSKNPQYIPGWLELERNDKMLEIDPNYIIP